MREMVRYCDVDAVRQIAKGAAASDRDPWDDSCVHPTLRLSRGTKRTTPALVRAHK